jgi:hypothetical protein
LADIEVPKLLRWISTEKLKVQYIFPGKVVFFAEVLKKFPKLPYFVVAKELYNQEQKGGGVAG